jgi:hypothetical protein
VDKSYRGLYRCCGGKLPADPPPADKDSTADRTPIQKTYPCSCHITPEALSEKEKEGLKEAQDKEAYLSELNPAVQCTCTNEENVPLCLSDPKIASKEMTEAFWDVKKADIPRAAPTPQFDDPNTPTRNGLTPSVGQDATNIAHPVLSIQEMMDRVTDLTELREKMASSKKSRIESRQRIKELDKVLKQQGTIGIPIEKIQGPPNFLAEKHDVKVYDKFPAKKPKVSVTTSAEQIESQATLVDLKKTMEEFGADIESAKQEEVAAK